MPDDVQTADGAAGVGENWSFDKIAGVADLFGVTPAAVMQQIVKGELHLSNQDVDVGPVSQSGAVAFDDVVTSIKNNPEAFIQRLVRNGQVRVAFQNPPGPRISG